MYSNNLKDMMESNMRRLRRSKLNITKRWHAMVQEVAAQVMRSSRDMEAVDKMERQSKQILDTSDKYAVEDIFDNSNMVSNDATSQNFEFSCTDIRYKKG